MRVPRPRTVALSTAAACLVAWCCAGAVAGAAADSPTLVRSSPADGSYRVSAPNRVTLTFNFAVGAASTISVTSTGPVTAEPAVAGGQTLSAALVRAPAGIFTVAYRAVQADGPAVVTGSIVFGTGRNVVVPTGSGPTVTYEGATPSASARPTASTRPTATTRPTPSTRPTATATLTAAPTVRATPTASFRFTTTPSAAPTTARATSGPSVTASLLPSSAPTGGGSLASASAGSAGSPGSASGLSESTPSASAVFDGGPVTLKESDTDRQLAIAALVVGIGVLALAGAFVGVRRQRRREDRWAAEEVRVEPWMEHLGAGAPAPHGVGVRGAAVPPPAFVGRQRTSDAATEPHGLAPGGGQVGDPGHLG